jgi:hypothetical protein
MGPPQVIWWAWVAVLVLSLADYLIQAHRFPTARFTFGALAVTGLVYGCAQWPVVIASERGIEVRNPIRRFFVPWVAVRGIYLADSVEVECARAAPRKNKTLYSWALSSPRRSRARAQLRAWQWDAGKRNQPSGYAQLPDPAKALTKMTTAEIMARELAAMSEEARFRSVVADVELDPGANATAQADAVEAGAVEAVAGPSPQPDGSGGDVLTGTWSWLPIAAFVLPGIGFIVFSLVK